MSGKGIKGSGRKRSWVHALATVVAVVACTGAWASPDPVPVNVGQCKPIESQVLHETRSYCVHLPASYGYAGNQQKHYPVLYVLDGETFFAMAATTTDFMGGGANVNYAIPEMIVVGIVNTKRTRDMSPTHSLSHTGGIGDLSESGGGTAFLSFLETELATTIDRDYRTQPYRVLAGHSFAGLATVNAFQSRPSAFQGYIAIDPSLWWDGEVMLSKAKGAPPAEGHQRLYIALANTAAIKGPFEGIAAAHMGAIHAYAQFMSDASSMKDRFKLDYFPDEEHGSVPMLALYNGLKFIFIDYKLTFAKGLNDPDSIGRHFDKVSETLGFRFLPSEQEVNVMGYMALHDMKQPDKAIKLFSLNTTWYPQSANAYDSLAEAYASTGNKALAIKNYQKALELNPGSDNARAWLKKLTTP